MREEREFFIDNLLFQIHFIIVMIKWNGLAPWGFEFPFPGSLTRPYLVKEDNSLSVTLGLKVLKIRFMVWVAGFGSRV